MLRSQAELIKISSNTKCFQQNTFGRFLPSQMLRQVVKKVFPGEKKERKGNWQCGKDERETNNEKNGKKNSRDKKT